jgi:hypothetical protein
MVCVECGIEWERARCMIMTAMHVQPDAGWSESGARFQVLGILIAHVN